MQAALKQILERIEANPAEAPEFGILQVDIDALSSLRAEITQSNAGQEKKRASAPLSTQDRNRIANRIVRATKRIKAAGLLAFATDATQRAPFEDLVLGPRKTNGKGKKKSDAPPADNAGAKPNEPASPV